MRGLGLGWLCQCLVVDRMVAWHRASLSALDHLLSEAALNSLLLQCLPRSLESMLLLLQVLHARLLCGLQEMVYN